MAAGRVHDVAAFGQDLGGVVGEQADELLAVGANGIGAAEGALAEEVLAAGEQAAEADVVGRDRTVGFLADDDEALFGAEDVHGLGAVGGDAEGAAGVEQGFPDVAGAVGGDVDFVGEFAAEADAEDARRGRRRHGLRGRS